MSFNVCLHILYHSTEFCWIVLEWNGFQPGWYLEQEEKFALFDWNPLHCIELYGSTCNELDCYQHLDWSNGREEMGGSHFALLSPFPKPAPCYIDQPHSKETRCACRLQKRPTNIFLCPFDVWQACQIEKSIYRWKRQVH